MTTAFDVPAQKLIARVAEKLKNEPKLTPPDWAAYAKTGVHAEKAPQQKDWWHTRAASVLRKVYANGPIGTERLAQEYGGFRDRGSKPDRAEAGSGSIARKVVQQLEAAGLLQNIKGRGRVVSAKGRSLCDNSAHDVAKELESQIPALVKY